MLAVVLQFVGGFYRFEGCGKGCVGGDDLLVALEQYCGLPMGDVVGHNIKGGQVALQAAGVVGGGGAHPVVAGFAEVLAPGQLVLQGVGVLA